MDSTHLVLEATDVSISFGGLYAVSGFSCQLREGELVSLIGPNGAGKTTMFNMISGVYHPTAGQISFWDADGKVHVYTKKISSDKLNKAGIARTFQNIRLFQNMSVLENVCVALHSSRRSSPIDCLLRTAACLHDEKSMELRAMRLLHLFGLEEHAHDMATSLPYGEQRRLEIARALASGPRLLLLDEPAAGMNGQETEELMRMIKKIRDDFHLTVLLIEHDMKLVMGISERIIVLNYGRIIAEGAPDEIRTNDEVIKAYLGSE